MISSMTPEKLNEETKSGRFLQMVDVRSATEFAAGHIPGAVNIPMDQLESRLGDISAGSPVVLICLGGQRAKICADILKPRFENLAVLEGGTRAWIERGLPVVAAVRTRWSLERQVRLGAGILVLAGCALALLVNAAWIYLAAFIGAGLAFAGLTDICPMGMLLGRMPWNAARRGIAAHPGAAVSACPAGRN